MLVFFTPPNLDFQKQNTPKLSIIPCNCVRFFYTARALIFFYIIKCVTMKKLLTLAVAISAVALFAGCMNTPETTDDTTTPVVTETTTPTVEEVVPTTDATGTTTTTTTEVAPTATAE